MAEISASTLLHLPESPAVKAATAPLSANSRVLYLSVNLLIIAHYFTLELASKNGKLKSTRSRRCHRARR